MRTRAWLALAFSLAVFTASAIDASNRYRSPRNPERRIRAKTDLIVLHTTEAPARSSLNKVSDRGECHFCVTEDGSVYRIVDRDREAFHAGRSMWNKTEDIDKVSIGIECVGYHDKSMPLIQIRAIKTLVKELQSMYKIPDHRVVCHSHVAYGAPNKWHKFKHRGRKRCGMLFAMPSVRRQLGLATRPAYDPDIKAGRLKQADDYLQKVLYGGVDTMAATYKTATPPPVPKITPRIATNPKKQKKPVAKPTTTVRPKAKAAKSATTSKSKTATKATTQKKTTPAKTMQKTTTKKKSKSK